MQLNSEILTLPFLLLGKYLWALKTQNALRLYLVGLTIPSFPASLANQVLEPHAFKKQVAWLLTPECHL